MTVAIRSLLEPKIAASLRAQKAPSDKVLEDWPNAEQASKTYNLPLLCERTGIVIGNLSVVAVAGHMPMLGQWKDSMILHPIFSLERGALIHFSKNTWFRYCNFSIAEGEDERLTAKQEQDLRIAALALLHNLTDVRQDIQWLPDWQDVSAHWTSLMALSYWKHYLDSKRFQFPKLHISRLEAPKLGDFLSVCWSRKKDYETVVNEKIEEEKVKAAEAAMIALRDELAGARPTSIKQIWRWFVANLPKKYKKDTETWMHEIYFAKGEAIREFTIADVDLLEEIFLCECPTGSSISHAFSEVLASKRQYLQQHFETFEIVIPQAVVTAKAAGDIPVAEPLLKDFKSRAAYMIAHSKWKLAHTDMLSNLRKAEEKNKLLSVVPSHRPQLVIRENDPQEEDVEEDVVLSALEAAVRDDTVTGENEE